jgi:hypothetical protein
LVLLQQTLDYFGILPGQGGQNVVKFTKEDRIPRFFDNSTRIELFSNQIVDLINRILKNY